ncbi:UvrB/UvrC motif-containing protein, partial [Candidatus Azambacteria bacterium]|nr:UvrB/UvrC motif-containing protein [Candidatus Azambacteria bacterium]
AQREVIHHLTTLQYHRNDFDPRGGEFRVRGEMMEVWLPSGEERIRLIWEGKRVTSVETMAQRLVEKPLWEPQSSVAIFPAKHFVTPLEKLELAIKNIEAELALRLKEFRAAGKLLETERLERRTTYDLEMLRETGYVTGIENYSRHLSFRNPGEPSSTLLDYFPEDWLLFIDESHMTVPQLNGMYNGDKARKEVLVAYGFRLPSALDNRPLKFEEFEKNMPETIFVSATPGPYEFEKSRGHVVEQLIRPTGLLEPTVEVRPTKNQIADLIREIQKRVAQKERTLVITLTKRLAEDLAEFLAEKDIRVHYLHSEIKTLARPEILRDLRLGKVDVIVGINLLREGLDLPEVALVAILDADKEGFLRNETTLIQTMGRAARNVNGHAILYADMVTASMKRAMDEVRRRRKIQETYNNARGITPKTITKEIRESFLPAPSAAIEFSPLLQSLTQKNLSLVAKTIEQEMRKAAAELAFEKAAYLRDKLREVRARLDKE